MEKVLGIAFILIAFWVNAEELPKASFGRYGGEMPGYMVELGGNMVEIEKHDVYITLAADSVIYLGGNLELSGVYTVFQQSKNTYVIKTQLTNGKSMHYEIDFIWRKKEREIYLTPENGQSAAVLEFIAN